MQRVVVGIDGTAPARPALARAATEARLRAARLEVIAVWSYPPLSLEEKLVTTPAQMADDAAERADQQVLEVLDDTSLADLELEVRVEMGAPAGLLLAAAEGSSLLVVGRRDNSRLRHLMLGSVADQCVRHSPVPIMVVPPGDDDDTDDGGPILVGMDGSDNARRALEWAIGEARLLGCGVRVVHCWEQPPPVATETVLAFPEPAVLEAMARTELHEQLAGVDTDGVDGFEADVAAGDPATVLLDEAHRARLLVVGSRGRGGFIGLLLGSVSRRVVHLAGCPVVVVPEP